MAPNTKFPTHSPRGFIAPRASPLCLVEQDFRFLDRGCVEALSKPVVDFEEHVVRLVPPALLREQTSQADGCAQLQPSRALLPRYLGCAFEAGFSLDSIRSSSPATHREADAFPPSSSEQLPRMVHEVAQYLEGLSPQGNFFVVAPELGVGRIEPKRGENTMTLGHHAFFIKTRERLFRRYKQLLRQEASSSLPSPCSRQAAERQEVEVMISKKLMAGAMAGFLTLGTYGPAWANPLDSGTNAAVQTPATPAGDSRSLLDLLAPILTEPVAHQAEKRCKPGELYSSHDIVGDPESCFLNHFGSRGTTSGGISGLSR